jgi:flagellar assembly protein FliH
MNPRTPDRFVPQERITVLEPWSFEAVDKHAALNSAQQRYAVEVEQREQAIRQDAYAQGFVQGHAQAMVEAQQRIQAYTEGQGQQAAQDLAKLLCTVQEEWDAARQKLAEGMLQLAAAIAQQVLLRQPRLDRVALDALVAEAMRLLEAEVDDVKVYLNPSDWAFLHDAGYDALGTTSARLLVDPNVALHGCLVRCGASSVDASLATRWRRVLAGLGLDIAWDVGGDDRAAP